MASLVSLGTAVGVTNLLLTRNFVADLQENLSKDILSFSERFFFQRSSNISFENVDTLLRKRP